MKTVNNWNDLSEFGINYLTGEACAYSMRLLCDVNEEGKRTLEAFFGGTVTIAEGSNWNSEVNGSEAIGSVLLSRGIFEDLAAFCLLSKYSGEVYVAPNTSGTENDLWRNLDTMLKRFEESMDSEDVKEIKDALYATANKRFGFAVILVEPNDHLSTSSNHEQFMERLLWNCRRYGATPNSVGGRNTHAMSGRTI